MSYEQFMSKLGEHHRAHAAACRSCGADELLELAGSSLRRCPHCGHVQPPVPILDLSESRPEADWPTEATMKRMTLLLSALLAVVAAIAWWIASRP